MLALRFGGFTDVLLRRSAGRRRRRVWPAHVELQSDLRVEVHDRINVLTPLPSLRLLSSWSAICLHFADVGTSGAQVAAAAPEATSC